jgi:hypothetical protein
MAELAWLLEGWKIRQRGAHRKLAYETVRSRPKN